MRGFLYALAILRVASGHSIITRDMLLQGESLYEPVPLVTRDSEKSSSGKSAGLKIRETPKELLRSLGYVSSENEFEGRDLSGDFSSTPDIPEEFDDEDDDYYTDSTTPYTTETPDFTTEFNRRMDDTSNTTALEERTMPPKPMPGFMAVLDAAFSCLWSGLGFECFNLKVVPMFRAMMGFQPMMPFGPPYYTLPRTIPEDEGGEEEDDAEDESKVLILGKRRRRRRRVFGALKLAMVGLAAVKGFILPIMSVMSILSGKAIVASLAAIVLSIAAGWSSAKSADRRQYQYQDTDYYPR